MSTPAHWSAPLPSRGDAVRPLALAGAASVNRIAILVAAASLVLVRLPTLAGGGSVRLAGLLPLVVAILLLSDQPRRPAPRATSVLWAFVAVAAVSLYRGQHLVGSSSQVLIDCLTLALLARFVVLLMTTATDREREARLAAVALAPAVFMAANVLLRLAGFESPAIEAGGGALATGDQAEMLSAVGLSMSRIQFPMSTGVNSTGAVSAAGFAAAALLAIHGTRVVPRKLSLAAAAVCLYGVLAIDTRGAFFFAVLLVLILSLAPRLRLSWLAFLLPFSPAIVLGGLRALASTGLVAGVSRSGEDLTTGNNRLYIWDPIWSFLRHPSLEMVYGYGAKGHISSGVSATYAYLFSDDPDPYSYSTHNVVLQTVLDSGYVGVAVLVALAFVALRVLQRVASPVGRSLTAMLLVLFLAGVTEALPNVLFMDTMVVAILAAGAALSWTDAPAVPRATALSWRPPPQPWREPSWLKGRT